MRSHVEAIRTYKLVLSTSFVLVLEKTFYVPSFSRNLISISRLVLFGYSFNFLDISLSLFYKFDSVGFGALFDGLYCCNLQNGTSLNAIHVHAGTKHCLYCLNLQNDTSSMLWHRRLGHISQQRIKRLVHNGVLRAR